MNHIKWACRGGAECPSLERKTAMKKTIAIVLSLVMLFALAACGGSKPEAQTPAPAPAASSQPAQAAAPAASQPAAAPAAPADTPAAAPAASQPAAAPSGSIAPASDGVLTLTSGDLYVLVNDKSVPMPYALEALEDAGVPVDPDYKDIELASGDFYSLNLYLDDNEDYLVIPAYYNDGDDPISITAAGAEEITLTTYEDDPVDMGVSLLGVGFGSTLGEVKAALGEASYDDGSYLDWKVVVPDINYGGSFSIYFSGESDDAKAVQIDLSVFSQDW